MAPVQRVSLEVQLAQGLAGNEQKDRDKSFSVLKKFIRLRLPRLKEPLTEDDFIKLWKGIHYRLWMQDKPLIQEKLVDEICELVLDFPNEKYTLMFIKTFFDTQAREWFGLDQYRINKFMMLVREFLHSTLVYVSKSKWNSKLVNKLNAILESSVLDTKNSSLPVGLKLHLVDTYLLELQKVADKQLSPDIAVQLLTPFVNILPTVKNCNILGKVLNSLYVAAGGKSSSDPRNYSDEKGSDEEGDKDVPRIGRCGFVERDPTDVENSAVKFNKEKLVKALMEKSSTKKCLSKNRVLIYRLIKRIKNLEYIDVKEKKSIMPMNVRDDITEVEIDDAVKRLQDMKRNLLEKVPCKKEYKKFKKTKKSRTDLEEECNGVDSDNVNSVDKHLDGEGEDGEEDDDLEFDAEEAFLKMGSDTKEDGTPSSEDEGTDQSENSTPPSVDDESNPTDNGTPTCGDDEVSDETSNYAAPNNEDEETDDDPTDHSEDKETDQRVNGLSNSQDHSENIWLQSKMKKSKTGVKRKKRKATEEEASEYGIVKPKKNKKMKKKKKKNQNSEEEKEAPDSATPIFKTVDFDDDDDDNDMNTIPVVFTSSPVTVEPQIAKKKLKTKSRKTKIEKEIQKKIEKESGKKAKKAKRDIKKVFPLPIGAECSFDPSDIETQNSLKLYSQLKILTKLKQLCKDKKADRKMKKKVNRYFTMVKEQMGNFAEDDKEKADDNLSDTVNGDEAPVLDLSTDETSCQTKESQDTIDFRKFCDAPPAFYRNVVNKAIKSKKAKKQKTNVLIADKTSTEMGDVSVSQGRKRVSFDMDQNKAFQAETPFSCGEPFHPNKRPDIGILKASPSPIRIVKKIKKKRIKRAKALN